MAEGNASGPKDLLGGRIFTALIVDDDQMIRKIHKGVIKKFGLQISEAENGKEAVDFHKTGARFDIVLMDREMPVMDGLEATRELRAMGVESMIVGVTSRDSDSDKQQFLESGLDDFQKKPLTVNAFTAIFQKVVERNQISNVDPVPSHPVPSQSNSTI